MPSLGAIATSLFGLALLTISSAQETTQHQSNANPHQSNESPHQSNANGTEAANTLLLTALNDVDAYSADVSTLVCVYTVNTLETKKNNYNFGVTGCKVDTEFVGRCPDLTSFPGCGSYNIVVSSKSKSNEPKVKSITKGASK